MISQINFYKNNIAYKKNDTQKYKLLNKAKALKY